MLNKLPPRERQIIDLLYQRDERTVAEICDAIPDDLSGSAVRAMLRRLEDKGVVTRTESDRGYVFSPVVADSVARRNALSDVVRTFFNGSAAGAASALVGMSDRMEEKDLDALERMIASTRQAKGAM